MREFETKPLFFHLKVGIGLCDFSAGVRPQQPPERNLVVFRLLRH